MPCFQSFPVSYYARFYSNSTITNQFCLEILNDAINHFFLKHLKQLLAIYLALLRSVLE